MKFSIFISMYFLFLVSGLSGQEALSAPSPEESARSLYDQQKYPEALSVWYRMVESGNYTAGVYYNIGLAESKLEQTHKAMIAFEKAHRLKPFSQTIQQAILQQRESIENGIIPVKPFFLEEWYRGFLALLRPGIWAFSGLLLCILGIFIFIRFRWPMTYGTSNNIIRSPLIMMMAGILMLFIGGLSYGSLYRNNEAILHAACALKPAPSIESQDMITLNPGEKVFIKDHLSGWYHISLLNLEEGWISSDCLSMIEMGKP